MESQPVSRQGVGELTHTQRPLSCRVGTVHFPREMLVSDSQQMPGVPEHRADDDVWGCVLMTGVSGGEGGKMSS